MCYQQIELSGFVANELSTFLTLKDGGVIHSHFTAALHEQGGEMAVGNSRPS